MSRFAWVLSLAGAVLLQGCGSTAPGVSANRANEALTILSAPLPNDLSAIYRLRVPKSAGLRMTVLARPDSGRLTVSRSLGSALTTVGWEPTQVPILVDYQEGCSLRSESISRVLGVGSLPLPQAVRLVGGRLPATDRDRVSVQPDGRLLVEGFRWGCLVKVARKPWRVVHVESVRGPSESAWSVRLSKHRGSVPGIVRFESSDDRWAEIELRGVQWNAIAELPGLPDFPPCESVVRSEESGVR